MGEKGGEREKKRSIGEEGDTGDGRREEKREESERPLGIQYCTVAKELYSLMTKM